MNTPIDIKLYLPHRAPMLMVDMISQIDSEVVQTTFKINKENIFTDKNTFIEAGLIENAAQTCSAIVARDYFVGHGKHDKGNVDLIGFISALKTLKIYALPALGSTIVTKARLISKFVTDEYSLCTMECTTYENENVLLEGEINLFIQERRTHAEIGSILNKQGNS